VQFPLTPEEERFVNANITSKESFQPGWLNDEVMYQTVMLVRIYLGYFIFHSHSFRLFQVVNFYFALLEETTSIKVSECKRLAPEYASFKSRVVAASNVAGAIEMIKIIIIIINFFLLKSPQGNVIHFSSFFYETLKEGKILEILR